MYKEENDRLLAHQLIGLMREAEEYQVCVHDAPLMMMLCANAVDCSIWRNCSQHSTGVYIGFAEASEQSEHI